jgi:hypothetical protein
MARHLEDVLDLEKEIEDLREVLYVTRNDLKRIKKEYFESEIPISEQEIKLLDDDLESIIEAIENSGCL